MRFILEIGKKYPEITGPSSDAFAAELKEVCLRGNFTELVLDLSGIKMISSMAMGTMFAISQRLREQDKTLHLINVSDKVLTLLRMVNMSNLVLNEG